MKKRIALDKKEIEYTLRAGKRTGRIKLSIYWDGRLVVTAPRDIRENVLEQLIIKKSQWIIEKLEYFKNNPRQISVERDKENYSKYKDQALILAKKRIDYFNKIYGFEFSRISVKNQKTRWGSCSKKRNLNFNYKIALLPERSADYIIVHELCHLKEFNHSPKFWSLVSQTVPEYLEIRRELKKGPTEFC